MLYDGLGLKKSRCKWINVLRDYILYQKTQACVHKGKHIQWNDWWVHHAKKRMADTTGRIPLWLIGTVTGIPVIGLKGCIFQRIGSSYRNAWLLNRGIHRSPFQTNWNEMIEVFLFGIVLGLIPITLAGLFVTAYLQYRRGDLSISYFTMFNSMYSFIRRVHWMYRNGYNRVSLIRINSYSRRQYLKIKL